MKRFGSGWAWLVQKEGKVCVESTSNADSLFGFPHVAPLLVIDIWEHAYYLDWQNARASHVKAIVDGHLDWSAASRRFADPAFPRFLCNLLSAATPENLVYYPAGGSMP